MSIIKDAKAINEELNKAVEVVAVVMDSLMGDMPVRAACGRGLGSDLSVCSPKLTRTFS